MSLKSTVGTEYIQRCTLCAIVFSIISVSLSFFYSFKRLQPDHKLSEFSFVGIGIIFYTGLVEFQQSLIQFWVSLSLSCCGPLKCCNLAYILEVLEHGLKYSVLMKGG